MEWEKCMKKKGHGNNIWTRRAPPHMYITRLGCPFLNLFFKAQPHLGDVGDLHNVLSPHKAMLSLLPP